MTVTNTTSAPAVWDRVVCGIDLTPASLQAAREAAELMPPTAQLTLCTIFRPDAIAGEEPLGTDATRDARAALDLLQSQIEALHSSEVHLREGPRIQRLIDEVISERATMVAIGSHRRSQAVGRTLGSVATAVLHEAPCSVLVAHDTTGVQSSEHGELVVGFDGSGGARRALAVARELAARRALSVRVIVAIGDTGAPAIGWARDELDPELALTEDRRSAVEALADASRSARLLVLGSRHLRGVLARSSVSEQVASVASCPVLVVR
jgi:nucleotide-binding universal stress UspA family protein